MWLQQVRNTRALHNIFIDISKVSLYSQLVFDTMRYRQSVASLHMAQYLAVRQALVGETTKGDHLIEQYTIAPYI